MGERGLDSILFYMMGFRVRVKVGRVDEWVESGLFFFFSHIGKPLD